MKTLGIWLPTRPKLRKVNEDKPGIFLDPIGTSLIREVKKEFKVVEGLDFRKASVINEKVFFGDYDATRLDGYMWFSHIDKSSDSHDMLILEQLEKTLPVINPTKGLKIGLDKFKTSSFLKANDIPVPEFALINGSDETAIRNIFDKWGSVLVKPRYGAFGIGICKIESADRLIDLIDFSQIGTVYVEKFYENDMRDWCGVNVVGGKVLYGYGKHESKIKDYKVFDRNQKGGEMVLKNPNSEQEKIALAVAKATGMDFFGVDIIKSRDNKYLVIDMNTFPGIYPDMMEPKKIAIQFKIAIKKRFGQYENFL